MTKILLIRHGETEYVDEALAGRINSPLNAIGIEQSQRIAEALKHLPIQAIHASPLMRTQQTAEPLAKLLNLEIKVIDALNQVHFGDWQGLSFEELIQDPDWQTFQTNPAIVKIPGGEDGFMVRERVSAAILALMEQHARTSVIAIFSHGSIIRHIVSYFIGLPLENLNQIRIAPASVTTLNLNGDQGKILHLNQEIPVNWL
ncbi:MAG: histidine phosphatase family protein [Anaerolineaceae bacterium]|jgi:broad specificity phosphatase PhoE|nr:histidine phosphatase family protein [Anaerolineaceae bacterium]